MVIPKKVVLSLIAATIFSVAGYSAGAAGETSSDPLKLKLGHSYGVDSLPNRAAQMYSENVAEATDGRVKIEVFPTSQLGSWEEMQEGLEIGSVDILIESVGTLERYSPLASVEGVPFLYDNPEHLFAVWDGPLGQEILDTLEDKTGFKLLGSMYFGQRILNTSRPIKSIDDLTGLKLRVPNQETYIQTWNALGASPTPMSLNEVFSAIEQGVVEGQENPVDVARFDSFYEVAPFITNTSHLMGNMHFQLWSESFNDFPQDIQDVMLKEAAVVSEWYRAAALDEEADNIAFLEDKGVKFFDVDRMEWQKKVQPVYDSLDPQVAAWVKTIKESSDK